MSGFPVTDGVTTLVPPPEGYVVDFDNPTQQKVLQHYVVFGIGGPLALVTLCQRYYTKIFLSKGLKIDDAFMLLAWASSVVTQAMLVDSIAKGGMCAHAWEMPLSTFEDYSVVTYVTAPIFMLCNGFTKLSLLTFYLHLSPQKWFRIAVWTSIGIVGLYTSIITLMMVFQCSPIRASFDFKIQKSSCIDAGTLYIATAVSNIVTDLILFVLPMPMIYQLRLGRVRKIGAMIIFGIGSMTVATSIVRLVHLPPTLQSTDPAWDAAPANVWSFVEANLFVICGSMPTLRKFFQHFMPRVMATTSNQRSYGPSYGYNQSVTADTRRSRRLPQRPYDTFVDMNEMGVLPSVNSNENDKETRAMASSTPDASSTGDGDSHSEKGILQTRSVLVQYDA